MALLEFMNVAILLFALGVTGQLAALLAAASKGCDNYENNKAAWMLESKPINLGFGMYLE